MVKVIKFDVEEDERSDNEGEGAAAATAAAAVESAGDSAEVFPWESSGDAERDKLILQERIIRSKSLLGFHGSEKFCFVEFFHQATKMPKEIGVTLPSDKTWRLRNYFKLLNKQREKQAILYSMPSQESDVSSNWDPVLLAQPELKRAKFSGTLSVSSEGSIPTSYSLDISWNSLDIAKAGMILEANSSANIAFQDEEEMRRVFTLLYDVFRYKHILNDALEETRFFQKYPEHDKSNSLVWLLFYDLHKRRFLPREHAETVLCTEAFDQLGLTPIERDLWKSKVKLAASLARNRIKNNALRLNQLLPNHLRDERLVSVEDSPMTGWINTFRMRLLEYQTYLHELGVSNCEIYAQKFTEIHPEAAVLENLVAIFATPPNSCTGVTDPVDLICSRGGDMYMLKALTQSELAGDSCAFLEEQKETLKYCMSLPQVQLVLYETHSMAEEENLDMVTKMINSMNDFAKEKHEEDHRLLMEQEEAEEKMNKPIGIPGMSREREREREAQESLEALAPPKEVEVPPCDLFELVPLPDLCSHGSECLSEEGCYLARIQRKEIISLDAKYMIKIAEARGLFGNELGQKKSSTTRAPKKREELVHQRSSSGKLKTRKVKLEIERITAPTQSSMHRTRKDETTLSGFADCPRHQFHTLESANKGEVFTARSGSGNMRRKSRTKKCQDESVRRLSKPNRRWSTSPSDLLSEVRPSFWRYATAKSVEDLIRALRKKRRNKRSFRLDDYFVFQKQQILQQQNLVNTEGIPGLQINYFGQKYLYPFRAPFINNKWANTSSPISVFNDYFEDLFLALKSRQGTASSEVQVNDRRLGSESFGSQDKKSRLSSSAGTSAATLLNGQNCQLFRQCLENASDVFNEISKAIVTEQKKLTGKSQNVGNSKGTPSEKKDTKQKPKQKPAANANENDKILKYLQHITKMEEVTNIISLTKSQDKKDIVLHEKYLPGSQATDEDRNFIKLLQAKLERLQGDFPLAHWSKKKEQISSARLAAKKK